MAAKWNLISFDEFLEKEGDEQSRLVATYETAIMMEAVQTRDAQREANRKHRKGGRS